jgi:hypothetical protein
MDKYDLWLLGGRVGSCIGIAVVKGPVLETVPRSFDQA